ncbi:MAG: hypothetical protein ACRCWB_11500 [Enterovibrio sp.]
MGIYNNIKGNSKGSGLLSEINSGIGGALGSVGAGVTKVLGGGAAAKRLGDHVGSESAYLAERAINEILPHNARNAIDDAFMFGSNILHGDYDAAMGQFLGHGRRFEHGRFWNTKNPLYGGITPLAAKQLVAESLSVKRSKKNIYLIKVSSGLMGDFSHEFNLFCVDVDHAPMTISGDSQRIGGAFINVPTSCEPDEIRITTLDDERGTIKRWFEQHAAAAVSRDGTVGLPATYAITFDVIHSFNADSGAAFNTKAIYRAASYDLSLSRRDCALEEISMTFTQLDTFARV